MTIKSEQTIFVVHTNAYSGNFERELCAYITGQVGDCGVGESMASDFLDDCGEDLADDFAEIIAQPRDDNGVARPCSIYPTPGRYNDGMGGHFDTAEGVEGGGRWPAYESVAVYFREAPGQDAIELMKDRAVQYALTKYNRKSYDADRAPLIITGFELVTVTTKVSESRHAV